MSVKAGRRGSRQGGVHSAPRAAQDSDKAGAGRARIIENGGAPGICRRHAWRRCRSRKSPTRVVGYSKGYGF